ARRAAGIRPHEAPRRGGTPLRPHSHRGRLPPPPPRGATAIERCMSDAHDYVTSTGHAGGADLDRLVAWGRKREATRGLDVAAGRRPPRACLRRLHPDSGLRRSPPAHAGGGARLPPKRGGRARPLPRLRRGRPSLPRCDVRGGPLPPGCAPLPPPPSRHEGSGPRAPSPPL